MSNDRMPGWSGTLVVMRHGQSVFNAQDRYTGHADAPLSGLGEQEARRAGELLVRSGFERFDHAFSSRLGRAKRTLELAMEAGVAVDHVMSEADLNERHYGDLQGMTVNEAIGRWGAEKVRSYQHEADAIPPGAQAESLQMLAGRVNEWFREVALAKLERGDSVLVAAHGGTLRVLMVGLGLVREDEVFRFPTALPAVVSVEQIRFLGDQETVERSIMASGRT